METTKGLPLQYVTFLTFHDLENRLNGKEEILLCTEGRRHFYASFHLSMGHSKPPIQGTIWFMKMILYVSAVIRVHRKLTENRRTINIENHFNQASFAILGIGLCTGLL